MKTKQELVDLYLDFKTRLRKRRGPAKPGVPRTPDDLKDMTDEEQAGMWLCMYGDNALHWYERLVGEDNKRWPTTRKLLTDALTLSDFGVQ